MVFIFLRKEKLKSKIRMALTYEKFYGGVSNAEQLMYKKSCVYSKSKEGKLK